MGYAMGGNALIKSDSGENLRSRAQDRKLSDIRQERPFRYLPMAGLKR